MVSRCYFPASGTAPITPAIAGAWTGPASTFYRANLPVGVHSNTTATSFTSLAGTLASNDDTCFAQFISGPIDIAQAIAGTFSIVVGGRETAGTDNLFLAVVARVLSNDGSTVRGTLLTQTTDSGGTEYGVTERTRIWSALTLTNVNAQAGDRIVVEVGGHANVAGALAELKLWFGDPVAGSDSALTSGQVATNVHWCEFSQTITFGVATIPTTGGEVDAASSAGGLGALNPSSGGEVLGSSSVGGSGSLVPAGGGEVDASSSSAGTGTATPSRSSGGEVDASALPSGSGSVLPEAGGEAESASALGALGIVTPSRSSGGEVDAAGVPSASGALSPSAGGESRSELISVGLSVVGYGDTLPLLEGEAAAASSVGGGGTITPSRSAGGEVDTELVLAASAAMELYAEGEVDAVASTQPGPELFPRLDGECDCTARLVGVGAIVGEAEGFSEAGYYTLRGRGMLATSRNVSPGLATRQEVGSGAQRANVITELHSPA